MNISMLKLLKNKKTVRSVVRGWAIYYFIVMLIPIIISVFSYTKSQNVLSEQVTDVNFKLLQQITDRQEKNLINVQRISFFHHSISYSREFFNLNHLEVS